MPSKHCYLISFWFILLSIWSVAEARTPYYPQVNSDYALNLQLEDRKGHIWFTDPHEGFVEYDGRNWWLHKIPEKDLYRVRPWYSTITQDQEGELYFQTDFTPPGWLSSFGYPVYYYFNRNSDLIPLQKPESTPCYTASKNVKNDMDSVHCRLLFDQKNRMYLDLSISLQAESKGSIQEYYRLEGSRWVSLLDRYQLPEHIRRYWGGIPKGDVYLGLSFDRQNRLWFNFFSTTEPAKSLLILVDNQEKVHLYPNHDLYFKDSRGNIWSIYHPQPGIDKLVRLNSSNNWVPDNFMAEFKQFPSLHEDLNGDLWAITGNQDIYQRFNRTWKKMYSVPKYITALAFDKNNLLWASTGNDIIRFHKGKQTRWSEVLYLESDASEHPHYGVDSIFVDRRNNKWFQFSDDYMVGYERTYHKTPLMFDGENWQFIWTSPLLDSPNNGR